MSKSTNAVKSRKEVLYGLDWLIEQFPQTFFRRARDIKPLQIGIYDDIIDFYCRLDSPSISRKQIREALNYYSASPAYLLAQQPDAARVNIYGLEVDHVTIEQAKYALNRYQTRYLEKKKTDAADDVQEESLQQQDQETQDL